MKNLNNIQLSPQRGGLLLSDGYLVKRNPGRNANASFSLAQTCNPENINVKGPAKQGELFYLNNQFKEFINTESSKIYWATTKGKKYPY